MSKLVWKFDDGYEVPKIIKDLPLTMRKLMLNFIESFLVEKNAVTEEEIKAALETKNEGDKKAVTLELQRKQEAIDTLTAKIQSMITEHNNYINEISEQQRIRLERMYNERLNEEKKDNESILQVKTNCINKLTNEIDQQKAKHERITQELYDKIDNYSKEIEELHKKQRDKIELECNKAEKRVSSMYEQLFAELKALYNRTEQAYETRITDIQESNNNLIDLLKRDKADLERELKDQQQKFVELAASLKPAKPASMAEVGQDGEKRVYDTLREMYPDASVEMTSQETASGDIFFKRGKLRCMIEVKNKATLDPRSDIEKFIRDIEFSHKTRNINCALFVSLRTSVFPHHTSEAFQYEIVHGIPVVYIHLTDNSYIKSAVYIFDHIASQNASPTADAIAHKNTHKEYYAHIVQQIKYIDKLIYECRKTETVHTNTKRALEKKRDELEHLYYTYFDALGEIDITEEKKDSPVATEEKKDVVPVDTSLNTSLDKVLNPNTSKAEFMLLFANKYIEMMLKEHYKKTPLSPAVMYKSIGATENDVARYGCTWNNLVEYAKYLYACSIFTQELCIKLENFIKDKATFPTRDDDFFNEKLLRKYNLVLQEKRQLQYMEDFYNQNAHNILKRPAETTKKPTRNKFRFVFPGTEPPIQPSVQEILPPQEPSQEEKQGAALVGPP